MQELTVFILISPLFIVLIWLFYQRNRKKKLIEHEELEPLNFSSIKIPSVVDLKNENASNFEKDHLGMYNLCLMDRVPSGPIIAIEYVDANGLKTDRLIAVKENVPSSSGLFVAYCFLRADERNFKIERVTAWYDPISGELYADASDALKHAFIVRKRIMELRREIRSGRKVLHVNLS